MHVEIALILIILLLAVVLVAWIIKTIVGLALFLAVAGLAGWAAQRFVGYDGGFGFTFISGLIGGVVGIIIQKALGAPSLIAIGGLPLLWTLLGSVIVVGVAKLFDRPVRLRR